MSAFELPKPRAELDLAMDDGAVIRVRQHGSPDGARLFLSHGNGFATDAYYPFWAHLDDFELIVYDQRNHGRNPFHTAEAHHMDRFVADLCALLIEIPRALGPKPPSGVFHSLSAIAAVKHAAEHPFPWEALVLVDPPFRPPSDHPLYPQAREGETRLSEGALRRQRRFAAPEELASRMQRQARMGTWVDGAYELMARSILRRVEGEDGPAWELACPPECESRVFSENSRLDLTPTLPLLAGRALFLCGDPEREGATAPALINRAMHLEYGQPYCAMPGLGHMLQLEAPEEAAAVVRAFLASRGVVGASG